MPRLNTRWSVKTITHTIPVLEVLTAGLLWVKTTRGASLLIIGALCAGFTLLYASAAIRGFTPDCGCFGSDLWKVGNTEGIIRGLLLTALAAWLWQKTNTPQE